MTEEEKALHAAAFRRATTNQILSIDRRTIGIATEDGKSGLRFIGFPHLVPARSGEQPIRPSAGNDRDIARESIVGQEAEDPSRRVPIWEGSRETA